MKEWRQCKGEVNILNQFPIYPIYLRISVFSEFQQDYEFQLMKLK